MLFSEFNSVSNSISNFVRIGENEFDRCSVNFTNRFPIFSATEEYGLDCHAVSRLAALRRVYGLQRLCPRVLSNQRHSHLFYLLVLFSTPLFYPQVPSMDRCRIRSVLSPDDCSNGPLVHSLRSVRFRIRTFLLNLIFRVSHFRTVSAENKAQNIDIAVHKKSVIWGSLYQQTISAIRQVDDQSINLSTEASFTFSSGYWVWIFV